MICTWWCFLCRVVGEQCLCDHWRVTWYQRKWKAFRGVPCESAKTGLCQIFPPHLNSPIHELLPQLLPNPYKSVKTIWVNLSQPILWQIKLKFNFNSSLLYNFHATMFRPWMYVFLKVVKVILDWLLQAVVAQYQSHITQSAKLHLRPVPLLLVVRKDLSKTFKAYTVCIWTPDCELVGKFIAKVNWI